MHKNTEAESIEKHIGENFRSIYAQKVMAAMKITFLIVFSKLLRFLMILVSNHTFLIMQNLSFALRNSAKVYLTK